MPRKQLKSTASRPGKVPHNDSLDLLRVPPAKKVVHLPANANSIRNLDFTKHYGNGCDIVTYAAQRALDRMVTASIESDGKTLRASSISSYFFLGMSVFLPFCAAMALALKRELQLSDIDRKFIDHFITHLRQLGGRPNTQKTRFATTKSVLVAMGQWGWIAKSIFPKNPFPNTNRLLNGQTALSEPERKGVTRALKAEMQSIINGYGPLTSKDLTICLMAIAVRTGINPTPAVELLIDCLQPHPIKKDRYVLVSLKRRGNATHIQSLRHAADVESMVSALPDVARIIDLVRERNDTLRQTSDWPTFLFVYDCQNGRYAGAVAQLTNKLVSRHMRDFVARHQLTDADDVPLRLNVMRLRKTFENRVFTLSGQDPFLTARLGGHSIKVSDNHYLEAPESAARDWRLMGEIRNEGLMKNGEVECLPVQNTPVAHCRDTLNGQHAPNNGEHCQKFLTCFRCRSFVVTGDDLYRVFSLYWALARLRQKIGTNTWNRVYGHIIRIIDQEIAPQFDVEMVKIERQRARVDPHPFWRDPEWLEGAA